MAGTTLQAARADHKHGMPAFATPASVGAANANGAATTVPRSDHVHGLGSAAFGSPVGVGAANSDGVATTAARSDHVHTMATASLGAVSGLTGTNVDGVATTASRSDHKHSFQFTSQAAGDIFYATGSANLVRLGIGAATTVLHGGASAPAYSQIVAADITPGTITAANMLAGTSTMLKISESLAGSAVANFDLTSIPGTYRHLMLEYVLRGDTVATTTSLFIRFNNDSGANYDMQYLIGNAATASGVETFAATSGGAVLTAAASATASVATMGKLVIPDYAGTTWQKTALLTQAHKHGTATTNIYAYSQAMFWRSTAAISRITLTPAAGNWATGSRVTLWGVPA